MLRIIGMVLAALSLSGCYLVGKTDDGATWHVVIDDDSNIVIAVSDKGLACHGRRLGTTSERLFLNCTNKPLDAEGRARTKDVIMTGEFVEISEDSNQYNAEIEQWDYATLDLDYTALIGSFTVYANEDSEEYAAAAEAFRKALYAYPVEP